MGKNHSLPHNGEGFERNDNQVLPDILNQGELLVLKVGSSIRERRIDKYLHHRLSNYSRAMIQDIIKAGSITVNGQTVKPSFKLTPGDKIELTLPEPPSKEIIPEEIPLNIIYEDDDMIIINKQADMIVHPARSNKTGTLVNALAYYSDNLSDGLGEFRPGVVHRLDKNTTGVMVIAKNNVAQWKIAEQFANRTIKKIYLAVVQGVPELTADCINAPLGMHPKMRERTIVRPQLGKEAITFYKVLEEFKGYSLLELNIKTGRTHQIRVHLSYIKHPIVADETYNGKLVYPWQIKGTVPAIEEPVINRVALHAHSLELKHPATEKIIKFEAPLPDDMQHLLDMLRKYRKK